MNNLLKQFELLRKSTFAIFLFLGISILLGTRFGVVVASEAGQHRSCGSECLFIGLRTLGVSVADVAEIESRLGGPPHSAGYSIGQLEQVATGYGVHAMAVKTNLRSLSRRQRPFVCIAHTNRSHFVILSDVSTDQGIVEILDPQRPPATLPGPTFEHLWTGACLLLSPVELQREHEISETGRKRTLGLFFLLTSVALTLITWRLFTRRNGSVQCPDA